MEQFIYKSVRKLFLLARFALSLTFAVDISFAQQQAPRQGMQQRPAVQPKIMTLSPEVLRMLQTKPTRSMMLEVLMANPATRKLIEGIAQRAGMQPLQLQTRSLPSSFQEPQHTSRAQKLQPLPPGVSQLPGKKLPNTGTQGGQPPAGTQYPLIRQLDWFNGLKFTFTRPVPVVCFTIQTQNGHQLRTGPVGHLIGKDITIVNPAPCADCPNSIDLQAQQDILWISYPGSLPSIEFELKLPPERGVYMISIQGIDYVKDNQIKIKNAENNTSTQVQMATSSQTYSLVGLMMVDEISPAPIRDYYQYFISISPVSILSSFFGGITITRL
jgi:hypothetical protein